ncbi:protein NCBP2AS2-like [Brachyistius frenatus]|uniref:protein NCBP2AS2-like n=1 Tax=Brachyistius frenatus TaxID=100188 RepID=UPI0037E799B0
MSSAATQRSLRSPEGLKHGTAINMLSRMLFSLINKLHVVEKLAESRPIRRAAQITAYAITRAQIAGRDASERVLKSRTLRQARREAGGVPGDMGELSGRLRRVRDAFVSEVKEGWKDGSGQIKK